jgi:hypothetical protein
MRNCAGCHARLGDNTLASVCGRRAGQVERRAEIRTVLTARVFELLNFKNHGTIFLE